MTTIALHTHPDWDALSAAWLLARYHPACADQPIEYRYLRSGETDTTADFVVDTGGELDSKRGRFDHHQLRGADANTSATELVFAHLLATQSLGHLFPLIQLINAADLGKSAFGADVSRRVGIHALLSAEHRRLGNSTESDALIRVWAFGVLDDIASGLKYQAEAEAAINVALLANLGSVLVLWGASAATTRAAFERYPEALMAVYAAPIEREGQPTIWAVGASRSPAGEAEGVHIGQLTQRLIDDLNDPVNAELRLWFQHPAGWFAGRGSLKSPKDTDTQPITGTTLVNIGSLFRWVIAS